MQNIEIGFMKIIITPKTTISCIGLWNFAGKTNHLLSVGDRKRTISRFEVACLHQSSTWPSSLPKFLWWCINITPFLPPLPVNINRWGFKEKSILLFLWNTGGHLSAQHNLKLAYTNSQCLMRTLSIHTYIRKAVFLNKKAGFLCAHGSVES